MQTFTMFVGEALCLVVFIAFKYNNREKYEEDCLEAESKGLLTKINPLLIAIPAACDFITSTLAFFALSFMPASIYSMIRGSNVLVTTIFSVIFLKRILYRQHFLGLGLLLLGTFIVGLVTVLNEGADDASNTIIGILFLFASFFTFSS
jgi:drug/metabolite transporter (DMT)-like permease